LALTRRYPIPDSASEDIEVATWLASRRIKALVSSDAEKTKPAKRYQNQKSGSGLKY
jgi:hypothetical protein